MPPYPVTGKGHGNGGALILTWLTSGRKSVVRRHSRIARLSVGMGKDIRTIMATIIICYSGAVLLADITSRVVHYLHANVLTRYFMLSLYFLTPITLVFLFSMTLT